MALFIPSIGNHTMGESLIEYVSQRVHPDIREGSWLQIDVVGSIKRNPPAKIASFEKSGRPFNFQRPTATITNSTTIQLNCFPSKSYVQHYASVVATYLKLVGKDSTIVRPIFPDELDTLGALLKSNIDALGQVDVVIIGEAYRLAKFASGPWQGERGSETDLFVWQKFQSAKDKTIALLGFKENIWGETGGCIIRVLRQKVGVKCVLYIGTAGALHSSYTPNEWIVTGDKSLVEGRHVTWRNPLSDAIKLSKRVANGTAITVPSPLCETLGWLHECQANYDWVDCEVGYMAEAANDVGVEFGYLHIVTDNLSRKFVQNLSNEDSENVMSKRKPLYREMEVVIESLISCWDTVDTRP
jgi:hypothetical protein